MENLDNIHLMKDVGMFPYVLSKEGYYDSYIVSYGSPLENFPDLINVPDLHLVKRFRIFGNSILDGILWLILYSNSIDILNLYHYKPSTFIWLLVYKIFHPHGSVYVKLDIDPSAGFKMKMKKGSLKYLVTKYVLGLAKVVSCETKSFKKFADEHWPIEIKFIPNGIQSSQISTKQAKEKIILTVSRLGTEQKATDILLKSFLRAIPYISQEWKLVLIGPVTPKFKQELKDDVYCTGAYSDRIIFTGPIPNRYLIDEYYKKASIFTMPSRWEGFCLVSLEAISKGDYMLTSDLLSFKELIDSKYGKTFKVDDVDSYANSIVDLCKRFDTGKLSFDIVELSKYLNKIYSYESICNNLYRYISN